MTSFEASNARILNERRREALRLKAERTEWKKLVLEAWRAVTQVEAKYVRSWGGERYLGSALERRNLRKRDVAKILSSLNRKELHEDEDVGLQAA